MQSFPNWSCVGFPQAAALPLLLRSGAHSAGIVPHASPPAPTNSSGVPAPPRAPPHGLQLRPGPLLPGIHELRPSGRIHGCPAGSSAAARGDQLGAVPAGCRGTARSSVRLSWAAGRCCSAPGAPPALTSLSSPPAAVAQQLFRSFSLLSRSTPSAAQSSAPAAAGPCWSGWNCCDLM